MSTDVNAENLLFKGQKLLFIVFCHIRQRNIDRLLCRIAEPVEQTHLSGQGIFLFLIHLIQNLGIAQHILVAVAAEAIESTGFDKVFHGSFIDFFSA